MNSWTTARRRIHGMSIHLIVPCDARPGENNKNFPHVSWSEVLNEMNTVHFGVRTKWQGKVLTCRHIDDYRDLFTIPCSCTKVNGIHFRSGTSVTLKNYTSRRMFGIILILVAAQWAPLLQAGYLRLICYYHHCTSAATCNSEGCKRILRNLYFSYRWDQCQYVSEYSAISSWLIK